VSALDPSLRPSLARRAGALAVDALLLLLVLVVLQLALRRVLDGGLDERLRAGAELYRWGVLTLSLPMWAYFLWFETAWGRTPGKRALGLRVHEVGRERARGSAVLRRTAVKMLPWELLLLGYALPAPLHATDAPSFRWALLAGLVLYGFYALALVRSSARQGPHDRAAGTVVVRER
jgi:uncharacterized RDD family membrane protein YckC